MIRIPSDAQGFQDVSAKRKATLADQVRLWIDKAEGGVQSA